MKVIKEYPKKTFVTFLLDDSGSMRSVVNETIIAFNRQLEVVKTMEAPNHEVYISFMIFSDSFSIKTLRRFEKASEVRALTTEDYGARGGFTALLDAMHDAIGLTEEKSFEINQGNNAALINFVTDGGENASRRFTKAQIKEKIQALQASDRWTFTFMGTESIDSVSDNYGINHGNITVFQHGAKGMHVNSTASAGGLRSYSFARSSGLTSTNDFYSNPETQEAVKKETENK